MPAVSELRSDDPVFPPIPRQIIADQGLGQMVRPVTFRRIDQVDAEFFGPIEDGIHFTLLEVLPQSPPNCHVPPQLGYL